MDTPSNRNLGRAAAYALAVAAVGLAVGLETIISQTGTEPYLSLTPLALAVVLTALTAGLGPGLFALLLSVAAIDFYILAPGSMLSVANPTQAAVFFLYLGGWLTCCWLADRVYRQIREDRRLRSEALSKATASDRLAQLTAALGQARTPRAVIEAAVYEPLHALAADAGMLVLAAQDGKSGSLGRAVGYPGAQEGATIALGPKSPISDALGGGVTVIVDSPEKRLATYPDLDRESPLERFTACVAVPLAIGSRVVAVVRLDFASPRTLTPDERTYLDSLGARAAQALDRTWQLEFALRARAEAESLRARADQELLERQNVEDALRSSETRYRALAARTVRLHAFTGALSEAVTLDAVAQAVAHHGRIVAGATTVEVALLVENGTELDILHVDPPEDAARPRAMALEPGLCAADAVHTRQPVFIGTFADWQQRYPRSALLAADGGYASAAMLPLLVEGAAIGVLTFYFTVPVNFDEDYRALLVSVAQHCAQALDRSRLYESAQRARADAERANRVKDEFVSIVSHELRTPLNAILGWTSILQRRSLDSGTSERALQSIRDNATRQTRLIDELLDFSRIVAGRTVLDTEEVDMRDLIRGVVESMIPTASVGGIDLRLSPVPPVKVMGDVRRLEQVFFNLVGNALKFTPRGGQVAIDVRIVDGLVEVHVSDNGAGIEPEFLPHVFDRFRQADSTTTRTFGGLGLGLSIAKQLVDAHKGRILAESAGKGLGATFIVKLPILAGDSSLVPEFDEGAPAEVFPAPSEEAPRLDGVRVLVVDDELDTREIMAHALEDCGARVTVAANARDALAILERIDLDVLLADIAMPEEDGLALIRRIRSSGTGRIAAIPAAAVTARAREDERLEALAAGFHLHLAKPFEPIQLARTVETLIRSASIH
jgi:signal transduction histidine kinase/CheY-like chemotaxis protein